MYRKVGESEMKCSFVEACASDADAGSIGAFFVMHHARIAGHEIVESRHTIDGCDIELISVHHSSDLESLARMPKKAPIRIVGGHAMQANARPAIPFADVVFIGEAEERIGIMLDALQSTGTVDSLRGMPGVVVTKDHVAGGDLPGAVHCKPLPNNPPYLNRPDTRSAAWYIEIARGCPFSCNYCELGHSSPYRFYRAEHIKGLIDKCDLTKTRKVNFFAPDEASHPDWDELHEYVHRTGYLAGFSSMRVDQVLRKRPKIRSNSLVRVGVDGLSGRIRRIVNKKISDEMLVEYFDYMLKSGHVQFKMFQIFNYPFETADDWKVFETTMQDIKRIPIEKNVSLRIKWTPFIPQPVTPLCGSKVSFSSFLLMKQRIEKWHAMNRRPKSEPGIFVENDGIMSHRSYQRQVYLAQAGENAQLF